MVARNAVRVSGELALRRQVYGSPNHPRDSIYSEILGGVRGGMIVTGGCSRWRERMRVENRLLTICHSPRVVRVVEATIVLIARDIASRAVDFLLHLN